MCVQPTSPQWNLSSSFTSRFRPKSISEPSVRGQDIVSNIVSKCCRNFSLPLPSAEANGIIDYALNTGHYALLRMALCQPLVHSNLKAMAVNSSDEHLPSCVRKHIRFLSVPRADSTCCMALQQQGSSFRGEGMTQKLGSVSIGNDI